ncbi:MAG: CBS domain-containing protein [Bacillota bacterium]|nr:CBS domain-containing protein [Bacillota bacterium]
MRLYLSSLQGRRVMDAKGDKLAKFVDLTIPTGEATAEAKHVIMRTQEGLRRADARRLVIGHEGMICEQPNDTWMPLDDSQPEVRLIDDVMDKQVVDIGNRKIIRVNDIVLDYLPGRVLIKAVCVGAMSFLRRLGGERLASTSRSLFRNRETTIDWHHVMPLGSVSSVLRLAVPWDKAAAFHPADLAVLMEDLDSHEQIAMLSNLDLERAAETLASIEEDQLRASILRRLDPGKASDIVEEMSPDDAADFLADLPGPSADAILDGMEKPSSDSVRRLMEYDERTAGGIMTTEYVALPPDITVDEGIKRIRAIAEEAEAIYYIYVVDAENRLVGVFSLRELIVSRANEILGAIMTQPVIHAETEWSDHECADMMAKYDFVSLPVTDEKEHLLGIITIDDAIDLVMERGGWRRRLIRRRSG